MKDPGNAARLQWLGSFGTWVAGQNSPALTDATMDWLPEQRSKVLGSLKKPEKEEYKFWATFALEQGSISFLEDR